MLDVLLTGCKFFFPKFVTFRTVIRLVRERAVAAHIRGHLPFYIKVLLYARQLGPYQWCRMLYQQTTMQHKTRDLF